MVVYNHDSVSEVTIKHNDRIAQLIPEKCESAIPVVDVGSEPLQHSERGSEGFGSTGGL